MMKFRKVLINEDVARALGYHLDKRIRFWQRPPLPKDNRVMVRRFLLNEEVARMYDMHLDIEWPYKGWKKARKSNGMSFADVLSYIVRFAWIADALATHDDYLENDPGCLEGRMMLHQSYGAVEVLDVQDEWVLVQALHADIVLPGYAVSPEYDTSYCQWAQPEDIKSGWMHRSELIDIPNIEFTGQERLFVVIKQVRNYDFITEDITDEWRDDVGAPRAYAGLDDPEAAETARFNEVGWEDWKPQKYPSKRNAKTDESMRLETEEGLWIVVRDIGFGLSVCAQIDIDEMYPTGRIKTFNQELLLGMDGHKYTELPWYQRNPKAVGKKLGMNAQITWMNPGIPRSVGEKAAELMVSLDGNEPIVVSVVLGDNGLKLENPLPYPKSNKAYIPPAPKPETVDVNYTQMPIGVVISKKPLVTAKDQFIRKYWVKPAPVADKTPGIGRLYLRRTAFLLRYVSAKYKMRQTERKRATALDQAKKAQTQVA